MSNETGTVFHAEPERSHRLVERGDGIYLYDEDGRRYIDGTSGIAVVNVGHGRVEIADAMKRQAEKVSYAAPNMFSNRPAEQLAGRLRAMTAGDLTHFHFVSGGSEAIEVAMKLSRQYFYEKGETKRFRVISRNLSYHGATLGALSISGHEGRTRKFRPMLLDFPKIPPAYCYRCPFGLTYPSCGLKCAYCLEDAIRESGPDEVSAFVAEPVVGAAGGAIVPPPEYFKVIREICDKWGILFIADEVMTGFGRTGRLFAMEHWGILPDMVGVAKALSGGYAPMGAVMMREKVGKVFEETPFEHVLTFGAHPVAAAAALEVLDITEKEDLISRARHTGAHLLERLEVLMEIPIVGDVRGLGLLAGVELVKDRETKEPFPSELRVSRRVYARCLERGLTIYPGSGTVGTSGDHFLLCPPLIITNDQVDQVVEILRVCLAEVGRELA